MYLGIYTNFKHFILRGLDNLRYFFQRSDDLVESQRYETLSANVMMLTIGLLLLAVFLVWVVNKMDSIKYEREDEKWDNDYAHPEEEK